MQGGHPDGIDTRKLSCSPRGGTRNIPLDKAYDSVEEISLSRQGDNAVEALRRLWCFVLATPLAWLHGEPDAPALRKDKRLKVEIGTKTVITIQKYCRHPLLDVYFTAWSFFAEEEFYLLALPVLFWNFNYTYARQMTYNVCWGLLVGNTLKDVFRLPRPSKKRGVWTPHSLTHTDSTACRDFGFPSTHSMNAVSNTFLTLLYFYHPDSSFQGELFLPFSWALLISAVWIFSISFGRLYLGVHSPTDVRGGLALGLVSALLWWYGGDIYDSCWLSVPYYLPLALLCSFLAILVNPQPRPMTPTFLQNCLLVGLMAGCTVGFRAEYDRRAGNPILVIAQENVSPTISAIIRTTCGYLTVLLARIIIKSFLGASFRVFCGLEPHPRPNHADSAVLSGWDLFAAACVKFLTYLCMASLITHGCPWVFDVVGVASGLPIRNL